MGDSLCPASLVNPKVCHPERSGSGVEGSSHRRFAVRCRKCEDQRLAKSRLRRLHPKGTSFGRSLARACGRSLASFHLLGMTGRGSANCRKFLLPLSYLLFFGGKRPELCKEPWPGFPENPGLVFGNPWEMGWILGTFFSAGMGKKVMTIG